MKTKRTHRLIGASALLTVLLPMLAGAQLYVQWQADLGGTNYEECTFLQPTDDGGCVVAGGSQSAASGNKAATFYGVTDYWLAKLNADGVKQWDRVYGGNANEYPNGLQVAPDGGYVLVGHSFSGVAGNKTTPLIGGDDWWVVKVDTNGIKQWDMTYGGTNNDYLYWAEPTSDGGFVLAGESESPASGNKSGTNYGDYDGWVMKIDGSGNKLWEQVLGGTNYDTATFVYPSGDGGWLVGGYSYSAPSGNKTSPNYGAADWWLVKLDADGNKQWEQSYGGSNNDFLKAVLPYQDGYLLFGTSWSDADGNKTTAKFGYSDWWLVKVDSMGNKQWEQVFGGYGTDYAVAAFQRSSDGGFLLGGYSDSIADGNKTVASYGDFDYWVIKLVPPPTLSITSAGAGQAQISWMPHTGTNWVLQESLSLTPANWTDSPSGWTNPVATSATLPTQFYRLFKP